MYRTLAPLSFLLAASLGAQDDAPASPLTVKTSDARIAAQVLGSFGGAADAPALEEGTHAVMTLDDGGQMSCTVEQGPAPFLWLEARPASLMDVFDTKVTEARDMAGMMGGMALGQMGVDMADGNKVIDGLFSFPRQVELLTLSLANNPEDYEIDAKVDIIPVADSWFGKLFGSLAPNQSGVKPVINGDAMLLMDVSVNLPALVDHLRPITSLMSRIGSETKEQRALAAECMDVAMTQSDGTFSVVFDPENHGMQTLAGAKDAKAFTDMWSREGYAELAVAQIERTGMAMGEYNTNAGEHRDVKIFELVQEFDDPMMAGPYADDGVVRQYFAAADGYTLQVGMGAGLGEMKAAIDRALDEEIGRKKMPANVLTKLHIDMPALMDFFATVSGGMANVPEETPDALDATISRTGRGLSIEVKTK